MDTNLSRRISRLATSMLIAATPLVVLGSPASAGDKSDCPSGYFCVWQNSNFEGDMRKYNNVDDYNLIGLDPIRSAYNHRTKRTYLNEGSGSSSTYSCFGAGDWDSSLSGWQLHANSAFLSTYTNC